MDKKIAFVIVSIIVILILLFFTSPSKPTMKYYVEEPGGDIYSEL
jgi:hypothetical protein